MRTRGRFPALCDALVLALSPWQIRFPRLAMTLWWSAVGTGCALALGSVIAIVAIGLEASPALTPAQQLIFTLISWLSLAIVAAAVLGV